MSNIEELKDILENIEIQIQKCKMILDGEVPLVKESEIDYSKKAARMGKAAEPETAGRIIEGVFDGQKMIGPDGKQYSVPANYISKSKLVEGDILKLTIDRNGNFVYKQIGPVERDRLIGRVIKGEDGEYVIRVKDKAYKVILASVTYFKGEPGDEIVILIPKSRQSARAAVETIVRK